MTSSPHIRVRPGLSPWSASSPDCRGFIRSSNGRKQIEAPKYLRPRTDTPKLTIGHGGCFSAIYSVRGAGGYQMFGITPAPIYDPEQKLPYFKDFLAIFRPGDMVKFKSISRAEYDRIIQEVDAGTFNLTFHLVTFSLKSFHSDPTGYARHLVEALHGH